MAVGDTKTVACQFPEEYPQEDCRGRAASFMLTLTDLKTKELPELDDAFAQQASDKETFAELRSDLEARLQEDAERREGYLKTTAGRMTQDAETTASLCRNVPGLGVTLDPSHFIHGHKKLASWEPILKYVCHVHLRDTKPEVFQVRIGQGCVEYGKIVAQLERVGYKRALCAHMPPLENVDQVAELRKMRLLLESLL